MISVFNSATFFVVFLSQHFHLCYLFHGFSLQFSNFLVNLFLSNAVVGQSHVDDYFRSLVVQSFQGFVLVGLVDDDSFCFNLLVEIFSITTVYHSLLFHEFNIFLDESQVFLVHGDNFGFHLSIFSLCGRNSLLVLFSSLLVQFLSLYFGLLQKSLQFLELSHSLGLSLVVFSLTEFVDYISNLLPGHVTVFGQEGVVCLLHLVDHVVVEFGHFLDGIGVGFVKGLDGFGGVDFVLLVGEFGGDFLVVVLYCNSGF